MAEPQGLCTFPGINAIVSATVTLSHGVQPSSFQIEMAPQNGGIAEGGTLRLSFGEVNLEFRDCRVDLASARLTESGQIWSVEILDRRWKWQFGEISGEYNRRDGKGNFIIEKTPRELARLLLDAAGETADTTDLPDDTRPHVEWLGENPMRALADLCDSLGFRVVMRTDGTVKLCKAGEGNLLPTNGLMEGQSEANPPERPDSIRVLGAPTIVQTRLDLWAVGLDVDGEIKRIDDLSYTPSTGWENETEMMSGVEEADPDYPDISPRKLAIETVFRWYHIDTETLPDIEIPDIDSITEREQILPLESGLVETRIENGIEKPQEPRVYGIYWVRNIGEPINSVEGESSYKYPGDFRIDNETGVVKFQKQVLQWDSENEQWTEASLKLECAFSVRKKDTGAFYRYSYDYPMPGQNAGTKPHVVKRTGKDDLTGKKTELQIRWYQDPGSGDWEDRANPNGDIDQKARFYALGAAQTFQPKPRATGRYAGLVRIELDGAIQQVSWRITEGGTTTEASLNGETNPYTPPYEQRRFNDKLANLLRSQQ